MKLQQSNILDLHMLVSKHLVALPHTGQQLTRLKLKAHYKKNHKKVVLPCGVSQEKLTLLIDPTFNQSTIIAMAPMVATHATSYLQQHQSNRMQSTI